jgi:hypothetical protein
MARYCVNAAVTVDAWAHVEADTPGEAIEQARNLTAQDYETGDALDVQLNSVQLDD